MSASYAGGHVSNHAVSDASSQRAAEATPQELPRCPCGHDRHHFMVSPENHYTLVGKVILMLGISVEPVKVTYQCRKCWKVFDETTDPKVMRGSC
jgi:hypothetical protein